VAAVVLFGAAPAALADREAESLPVCSGANIGADGLSNYLLQVIEM